MEQSEVSRLINKGMGTSPPPLLEQGRSHVSLGRKHEARLGRFGWPIAKTDALETKIKELDTLYSSRSSLIDLSRSATKTEAQRRQEAKAYIRVLRNAAPMVLRDIKPEKISESSFDAGGSIGDSTPKISAYLMKVRPFVKTLNDGFSPYFDGEDPAEKLEQIKSALDNADADQETKRRGLPEETKQLYLINGELLQMIEDMNRVAKIAFDGQAAIIGQFNKDILLRGGGNGSTDAPAPPVQ